MGWRHSQVFMVIPSRRISMRSCLNIAYRDLFTRCSRTCSLRKQYSYLLQCLNIAVCFLHIQALRRPFLYSLLEQVSMKLIAHLDDLFIKFWLSVLIIWHHISNTSALYQQREGYCNVLVPMRTSFNNMKE